MRRAAPLPPNADVHDRVRSDAYGGVHDSPRGGESAEQARQVHVSRHGSVSISRGGVRAAAGARRAERSRAERSRASRASPSTAEKAVRGREILADRGGRLFSGAASVRRTEAGRQQRVRARRRAAARGTSSRAQRRARAKADAYSLESLELE